MDRRTFTRQTLKASASLIFLPGITFPNIGQISPDELMGKGNPDLTGTDYLLRKPAAKAFNRMSEKAKQAGFQIKVVSGYRSYESQNRIWERKYKQFTQEGLRPEEAIDKIVEYSTIPGTSRHHWGTDLDIVPENNLNLEDELLEAHFNAGGPFHAFKNWLNENAASFGFYEVYTNASGRKGFKYEPWHFSYKALSQKFLEDYLKLDIVQILKASLLGGDYITDEFIQKYISENLLDINPALK